MPVQVEACLTRASRAHSRARVCAAQLTGAGQGMQVHGRVCAAHPGDLLHAGLPCLITSAQVVLRSVHCVAAYRHLQPQVLSTNVLRTGQECGELLQTMTPDALSASTPQQQQEQGACNASCCSIWCCASGVRLGLPDTPSSLASAALSLPSSPADPSPQPEACLVGAGPKVLCRHVQCRVAPAPRVRKASDAAAHSQRHEDALRGLPQHLQVRCLSAGVGSGERWGGVSSTWHAAALQRSSTLHSTVFVSQRSCTRRLDEAWSCTLSSSKQCWAELTSRQGLAPAPGTHPGRRCNCANKQLWQAPARHSLQVQLSRRADGAGGALRQCAEQGVHLQHGHVPQREVPEAGDVEEGDLVCALHKVAPSQLQAGLRSAPSTGLLTHTPSRMARQCGGRIQQSAVQMREAGAAHTPGRLRHAWTGRPRLRTSLSPEASRTSYWSPLVTTRSPLSFARTSRQAMTRFARPLARPAQRAQAPAGRRPSAGRRALALHRCQRPGRAHQHAEGDRVASRQDACVAGWLTVQAQGGLRCGGGRCTWGLRLAHWLGGRALQEALQQVQAGRPALLRVELRAAHVPPLQGGHKGAPVLRRSCDPALRLSARRGPADQPALVGPVQHRQGSVQGTRSQVRWAPPSQTPGSAAQGGRPHNGQQSALGQVGQAAAWAGAGPPEGVHKVYAPPAYA